MPIREHFPEADADYLGGQSDGWEYKTVFSGSTLKDSYAMVRQFLQEEGYADVPLPETVEDLLLFKFPNRDGQLLLFAENGYMHNPIKILFHPHRRKSNTLILHIYNERVPGHLLRFYGLKNKTTDN